MSSSIRISGEKYATCGPATISGWPLALFRALTSSALDIERGNESSPGPAPARRAKPPRPMVVPAPPVPGARAPETRSSVNWTEPRSGSAIVRSVALVGGGSVWYGNDLPCTVVGASGSLLASKLANVAKPECVALFGARARLRRLAGGAHGQSRRAGACARARTSARGSR